MTRERPSHSFVDDRGCYYLLWREGEQQAIDRVAAEIAEARMRRDFPALSGALLPPKLPARKSLLAGAVNWVLDRRWAVWSLCGLALALGLAFLFAIGAGLAAFFLWVI